VVCCCVCVCVCSSECVGVYLLCVVGVYLLCVVVCWCVFVVCCCVLCVCDCVLTQDRGWSVEYPDKLICAVRGFSVSIPCSYSYPQNHQFVWSKNNQRLNTSGPVLHFPALTVRDSGKYTCTWKTGETSGSETISLHVEGDEPEHWLIWVIVLVIVGVSVFVSVAVIHNRRRKVKAPEENVGESGEKTRTKPQFSSQVSHVADEEMLNKEEVTYSSVQKKAATKGSQLNRDPQPDEEDEGGVVYAPVWIKPNKATKQCGHTEQQEENDSVIYSSVKIT
ncbi:hypothetical protein QTP70_018116, partial [Hemibagrus guttatus]